MMALILKPYALLYFHRALVKRKYRLLYSPRKHWRPGPKGPSKRTHRHGRRDETTQPPASAAGRSPSNCRVHSTSRSTRMLPGVYSSGVTDRYQAVMAPRGSASLG